MQTEAYSIGVLVLESTTIPLMVCVSFCVFSSIVSVFGVGREIIM